MTAEPWILTGGADGVAALAARLRSADGPTAVVAPGLVVAPAALAPITADPYAGTALLVRPTSQDADVRVRHHLVTSVGSSFHQVTAPDHRSVGALVISANDAVNAADAVDDLVAALTDGGVSSDGRDLVELVAVAVTRGGISATDAANAAGVVDDLAAALTDGGVSSDGRDLVELVAVAVTRGGISLRAVDMVDVPWARDPDDVEDAQRRAASVPDARIAQLQANRVDDGFYSTFVVRRLSKPLTRVALRLGWTPNAITLLSFAIGIAAAAAFALGDRWALVVGAILLQVSLIVDCVDGEVARATRRFSALGAWLDASTDRVKEFLAYAGLAYGAYRMGADIWWLAVVLVVLQTTRHMSDYDFSRVQRLREAFVPRRDVRIPDDGAAGSGGGWSVSGAMEMSTRMNRRDAVRWAKRAIHLPIGERWLIISLGAAILGPTWALGILLVAGLLALAYVTAGRTLRTFTWRGPTPDAGVDLLSRQGDSGPILGLLGALVPVARRRAWWASRPGWAIPALLRLVELGVVALVVFLWHPTALVVGFWWMVVVAFHHYDTLYRAMQGNAAPRWLLWTGLGWEGRTILVVVLAAAGATTLVTGLTWGAWLLAALFVVIASVQWLSVQSRERS